MIRKLFKTLAGIACALICAEALAYFVYSHGRVYDPVLKTVFFSADRPVHKRLEGNAVSHWEAHGIRRSPFRSPDTLPSSPPVLVLGDSFTEAVHVNDDEVFTALVERKLQTARLKTPILNAGYSGRSMADYIAKASDYKKLFNPKWVIIQVTEDDFGKDSWNPAKVDGAFFKVEDGRLTVVPSKAPGELGQSENLKKLSLVRFGLYRLGEFRIWFSTEPPLFFQPATHSHPPTKLSPDVGTQFLIRDQLEQLLSAYDGRCTILFINRFSPSGRPLEEPIYQKVKEIAEEKHLSFVSLQHVEETIRQDGTAPFGFSNSKFNSGHLNKIGHKVVAEVLYPELLKHLAE